MSLKVKHWYHFGLLSVNRCAVNGREHVYFAFAKEMGRPTKAPFLHPIMQKLSSLPFARGQPLDDPDGGCTNLRQRRRTRQSLKEIQLGICQNIFSHMFTAIAA
jgi:hypothetical protein